MSDAPPSRPSPLGRDGVELRHLRAIVALADAESFTGAARMLGVTQPTLSRTVGQLERLLVCDLVMRTTRSLRLTELGERLVAESRHLLEGIDRILVQFGDANARPLRLGWAWSGLGTHTLSLLREWRAMTLAEIEMSRPDDPLHALTASTIDIAIVKRARGEDPIPDDFVAVPLFTERLVAALSLANPLATSEDVLLGEIGQHPVALCSVSPTASLRLWEGRRHVPRTLLAANTDEWLLSVASNEAIGVTSAATSVSHRHPDVVYRDIADSPRVEVSIVWRRDRSHAASFEFAEFAQLYFRELAGKMRSAGEARV